MPDARRVFASFRSWFQLRGGLDVVPDGRLVGRLEEQAVELAVDGSQRDPGRAVVLRDRRPRKGDRLQVTLRRELPYERRLTDRRDVRRLPSCDRGGEDRRRVVPAGRVGDVRPRVLLLETRDDRVDRLLLLCGPDADHGDLARHALARSGSAYPEQGHERRRQNSKRQRMESVPPHAATPFVEGTAS
jgi:hypothetical protein